MDKVKFSLLLLSMLLGGIVAVFPANKTNRAYKVLGHARIYEFEDKGHNKFLAEAHHGDTIYATEKTESFISSKEGKRMRYIPVVYHDTLGWVELSNVYPIRLSQEDSLYFVHSKSLEDCAPIERHLTPQMEWVMNLPATHMTWLYAILVSLLVAGVFCFAAVGCDKAVLRNIFFGLTSVSLLAMSAFEVLYVLGFYDHVLWFIYPSVVGGWGYALLFLLSMFLVFVVQSMLFYVSWSRPFKEPDSDATPWVGMLPVVPLVLGPVLMVLVWVDYACDTPFASSTWLWLLSPLALSALIGMLWHFRYGRILSGIVFPVCYVGIGLGLSLVVMLFSAVVLVAIVIGVLGVLAVVVGFSFLGALFGGSRVKGYTSDGKAVTGWEDLQGNIHGDDGKIYTKS